MKPRTRRRPASRQNQAERPMKNNIIIRSGNAIIMLRKDHLVAPFRKLALQLQIPKTLVDEFVENGIKYAYLKYIKELSAKRDFGGQIADLPVNKALNMWEGECRRSKDRRSKEFIRTKK